MAHFHWYTDLLAYDKLLTSKCKVDYITLQAACRTILVIDFGVLSQFLASAMENTSNDLRNKGMNLTVKLSILLCSHFWGIGSVSTHCILRPSWRRLNWGTKIFKFETQICAKTWSYISFISFWLSVYQCSVLVTSSFWVSPCTWNQTHNQTEHHCKWIQFEYNNWPGDEPIIKWQYRSDNKVSAFSWMQIRPLV